MKIQLLSAKQVQDINHAICAHEKQKSLCKIFTLSKAQLLLLTIRRLSISIWWPERSRRGIVFFITKAHAFFDGNKRTAGLASAIFLDINGYALRYPIDPEKDHNTWADIIDKTAQSGRFLKKR